MHAFGAHFVEVRVDADTGEVRVPRVTSVFDARPDRQPAHRPLAVPRRLEHGRSRWRCTRSRVIDHALGHYVNHDLAEYHVATNADVGDLDVAWLDEDDPQANALGAKGIGEIGITGAAAAVANAVHATGLRVRDLPITPDRLLGELRVVRDVLAHPEHRTQPFRHGLPGRGGQAGGTPVLPVSESRSGPPLTCVGRHSKVV